MRCTRAPWVSTKLLAVIAFDSHSFLLICVYLFLMFFSRVFLSNRPDNSFCMFTDCVVCHEVHFGTLLASSLREISVYSLVILANRESK